MIKLLYYSEIVAWGEPANTGCLTNNPRINDNRTILSFLGHHFDYPEYSIYKIKKVIKNIPPFWFFGIADKELKEGRDVPWLTVQTVAGSTFVPKI